MTGTIKKGDMKMGKEMREELNLNAIDRSMTSLRTLRFPEDEDIFWFRDDLHQLYPRNDHYTETSCLGLPCGS